MISVGVSPTVDDVEVGPDLDALVEVGAPSLALEMALASLVPQRVEAGLGHDVFVLNVLVLVKEGIVVIFIRDSVAFGQETVLGSDVLAQQGRGGVTGLGPAVRGHQPLTNSSRDRFDHQLITNGAILKEERET